MERHTTNRLVEQTTKQQRVRLTRNPYLSPAQKKVREKSKKCHNHKHQPFPDPKRKRKLTNLNKHKPNKRTKSTKISSLFPKRGNRNTKRTEKHKNKMTYKMTNPRILYFGLKPINCLSRDNFGCKAIRSCNCPGGKELFRPSVSALGR